jgi:type IV pilus assembly protein PilV
MNTLDLTAPRISPRRACPQAGFTMIEVLITFLVLVIGLLGLIGLQARSQQAEMESYQRGQALVLLQDMVDRINTNRTDAKNLSYVTTALTPAYVGGVGVALADCTALTGAAFDLCDWGNQLKGAAEVTQLGTCTTGSGADCIGAMLGARGCVSYDVLTELADSFGVTQPGSGIYSVSVVWQGVAPTFANTTNTCGTGLYPAETQRRVVTATLRIGALKAL